MKFTCQVDINKPIAIVAELFEDPETMKHCQDGFIKIEHLTGNKGQVGSTSKLVYKKFDLHETIIKNELPSEFIGRYEHKHMTNTMKVNFEALSDDQTRYKSEIEYTKFNGFFINVMAKLFPGMFKKQVRKWMDKFKAYAESQSL